MMFSRSMGMFRYLAALAFGLALSAGAVAGPISVGTWYLGTFASLGGPVTGGSAGGGASDPGAPAWTFTIADDHVLSVIDCCVVGDRFDVFNGGVLIGTTALGVVGGCVTATSCDALAGVGRGDFLLGAGTYSITMTVIAFIATGNNFFIVRDVPDRVPEPGTLLLVAAAVGALGLSRRRRGTTN